MDWTLLFTGRVIDSHSQKTQIIYEIYLKFIKVAKLLQTAFEMWPQRKRKYTFHTKLN